MKLASTRPNQLTESSGSAVALLGVYLHNGISSSNEQKEENE